MQESASARYVRHIGMLVRDDEELNPVAVGLVIIFQQFVAIQGTRSIASDCAVLCRAVGSVQPVETLMYS